MPFGLVNAPYLFRKFISPILEYLRVHHKISIELFKSLGFLINLEKSQLDPSN